MSLSSSDITTKLNGYITAIENSGKIYWNEGIVPTKYKWGFTNTKCGSNCRSNHFPDYKMGIQCYAFARFIAYLLTGTRLYGVGNEANGADVGGGWIKHTNLSNYVFCPGDIIEVDDSSGKHSAVVLSSDGTNVSVLEVWGSVGCQFAHKGFNDGKTWGESTVANIRSFASHVIKCPEISSVFCEPPATLPEGNGTTPTPEPEPEEVKVPVTFKKNTQSDGGPVVETLEYIVGQAYDTLPSAGSRTGYTFAGWWPEKDSRSSEFTVETIVPAWDHTLYAHWDANTYTLRCYTNYGDDDYEEYTVTYGQPYGNTLNPIEREGYEFNGWRTSRTDVNSSRYEKEDAVSVTYGHYLYAHWTPKEYAIFLYPGYGTNAPLDGERMVITNTKYGASLPELKRCGYKHMGWRAEDDSQTVYTSESTVTKEITKFTAIWEVKEVKVTYNYGYKENGSDKTEVKVADYGATYNEAWGTNIPAMDEIEHPTGGYDFAGWHHDGVDGADMVNMDTNHTLTAKWIPRRYNVTFDPCGEIINDGELNPITVTFGSTYGELPVPCSLNYYKFNGWYIRDENGEVVVDNVTEATEVTLTRDHILVADWTKERLIFADYGDGYVAFIDHKRFGTTYSFLTAPEREGYEFKGWYFDATYQDDQTYHMRGCSPEDIILPEHPCYIKAVYEPILLTVTFAADTDTGFVEEVPAIFVRYGEPYGELPVPESVDHYKFSYWYIGDEDSYVLSDSTVEEAGDHTLTALWETSRTIWFYIEGETLRWSVASFGKPYPRAITPSKEGYTFDGWYFSGGDNDGDPYVANSEDYVALPGHSDMIVARFTPIP